MDHLLLTEEREKRNREIEEQSQHFDSNGIEISKSKAIKLLPPRFKIKVERVADPELLKKVIDEMTSMDDFIQIDSNGKERKRNHQSRLTTQPYVNA